MVSTKRHRSKYATMLDVLRKSFHQKTSHRLRKKQHHYTNKIRKETAQMTKLIFQRWNWGRLRSRVIKQKELALSSDEEKKEEIWPSPMTKAPTPAEMSKGQSDNTIKATKKFDYTAIADQLRTVCWSNFGHPTGVVNRFTGPTFPQPCNQKDTHLNICK